MISEYLENDSNVHNTYKNLNTYEKLRKCQITNLPLFKVPEQYIS